jgi:prepilin-type N-terminal cleavage/methylation domain-containing protein/prepilin-type processing-associated H-X9-DG protein
MARRRGFTLIELLVVIAIIAILAAMLFPVFARARESARKIQCLANVKNVAIAFQMYLSDYDRLPPSEHRAEATSFFDTAPGGGADPTEGCGEVNSANPFLRWQVVFDEYVKNRDIWRCPSAKNAGTPKMIVPSYGPGGWLQYMIDMQGQWGSAYAPNVVVCDAAFPPGWGGDVTDSILQQTMAGSGDNSRASGGHTAVETTIGCNENENYDLKTSSVSDPAYFVVCGDTNIEPRIYFGQMIMYELCGVPCGGTIASDDCPWTYNCALPSEEDAKRFQTDASYRSKFTRHLGGGNIGYMDGHAAWMPADALDANRPYCTVYGEGYVVSEGRLIEGLCPTPVP